MQGSRSKRWYAAALIATLFEQAFTFAQLRHVLFLVL